MNRRVIAITSLIRNGTQKNKFWITTVPTSFFTISRLAFDEFKFDWIKKGNSYLINITKSGKAQIRTRRHKGKIMCFVIAVPPAIVRQWRLKAGDKISWIDEIHGNDREIMVRPATAREQRWAKWP